VRSSFENNAKAQNSGDPELFQPKAPFSRESGRMAANAEGVRVSLNDLSKTGLLPGSQMLWVFGVEPQRWGKTGWRGKPLSAFD
jgi:hypothetical protein